MDFFALDWSVGDDPKTERCIVTAHGKTLDGLAVCARIAFFPYFFVEVPSTWSLGRQKLLVTEAVTRYGAVQQYSLPVQRKSLWGFTNGEERPFVQLAFPSIRLSRRARQVAKNEWRMKTFEADIDPLVRLLHMRSLPPAGWVHISAFTEVPPDTDARVSRADVEVTALFSALHASSVAAPPPLVIASWDIECYSATRNFPLSHNEDDAIVCIGVTFQRADAPEPYLRTAICLGETGDVEGAEVVSVPAEHDVINEFFELLGREKVDFLVGWNTHNFDWRYVDGRAAVLHDDAGDPQVASGLLGRMLEGGGKAVERELSSAAYGSNSFLELGTPGIAQADLMQVFKREHKLDSYSLNAVSQRFLDNSCKIDLPASEMFRCFEGGPADRARLAEYCLRDTELPLRLMWRMSTLSNLLEMANATSVPLAYILNRGQQIKVFSLVTRKARELGFLVPDNEGIPADGEKYEGATVLSAERGAYFEPVSALDFASLYPSIMRAWNFCYSTLVLDDAKYGSVPGVEYHTCETGLGTFKYAQKVPSVLPALLEDLAKYRKAAKKLMAEAKAAGNAHLAGLYNGQQLAHKISMNSVYGFCGASKGFLACVPLAASTTAMGRSMIAQTKRLAEELVPGSRVIYGDTDSVMVLLAVEDSKKDDLEEHFRVAEDLAAKISATFPSPICLEFEKIYWPYLLFSKKRYAGTMFTNPHKHDYVDVKGLQLVRRDNAPIVKTVSQCILDGIMLRRDPEGAVKEAQECVLRVLRDQEPLSHFIISKQLRTGYKNSNLPHVHVASLLHSRRGYPVPSGERVPFVFVEVPDPDCLLFKKAEDPGWVAEHPEVRLDTLYYVENQLRSPIITLLELLVANVEKEVFGHPDIADLLQKLRVQRAGEIRCSKRVKKNASNNQREITAFFGAKTNG